MADIPLAEPRRKQKWNLNPRGKAWCDDSNKFGQRMLEKMGWSPGNGLGANEQGVTEPIRQSYKYDTEGVGYVDDYDDKWLAHHDDFSKLLNNLNNEKGQSTETANHNTTSLEARAKDSNARFYYHKLIKGKDLSRCSENDLSSILGSRKKETYISKTKDYIEGSIGEEDKCHGIKTVKGGTITDYFREKMDKLNSSEKNSDADTTEVNNVKKKKKKRKHLDHEKTSELSGLELNDELCTKKSKLTSKEINTTIIEETLLQKKKLKKNKRASDRVDTEITQKVENVAVYIKLGLDTKQKKKNDQSVNGVSVAHDLIEEVPKSKKKKRRMLDKRSAATNVSETPQIKHNEKSANEDTTNEITIAVSKKSKNKKKKTKRSGIDIAVETVEKITENNCKTFVKECVSDDNARKNMTSDSILLEENAPQKLKKSKKKHKRKERNLHDIIQSGTEEVTNLSDAAAPTHAISSPEMKTILSSTKQDTSGEAIPLKNSLQIYQAENGETISKSDRILKITSLKNELQTLMVKLSEMENDSTAYQHPEVACLQEIKMSEVVCKPLLEKKPRLNGFTSDQLQQIFQYGEEMKEVGKLESSVAKEDITMSIPHTQSCTTLLSKHNTNKMTPATSNQEIETVHKHVNKLVKKKSKLCKSAPNIIVTNQKKVGDEQTVGDQVILSNNYMGVVNSGIVFQGNFSQQDLNCVSMPGQSNQGDIIDKDSQNNSRTDHKLKAVCKNPVNQISQNIFTKRLERKKLKAQLIENIADWCIGFKGANLASVSGYVKK